MLVNLPRTTKLGGSSCLNPPELTITGTADVVVLVLMRQPYKTSDAAANGVFAVGRFPRAGGGTRFDTACGQNRTLTAGTYRLVVEHTPGTAAIALHLHGLLGKSELRPTARSRARLHMLPELTPSQQTAPVQAEYGGYETLAGRGIVLDFGFFTLGPATALANFGDCNVPPGQPPIPDAVAFSSACPTGVRGNFLLIGPAFGATSYFMGGYFNIAPGRWGDGVYYDNAGAATNSGAFATWIPFGG